MSATILRLGHRGESSQPFRAQFGGGTADDERVCKDGVRREEVAMAGQLTDGVMMDCVY